MCWQSSGCSQDLSCCGRTLLEARVPVKVLVMVGLVMGPRHAPLASQSSVQLGMLGCTGAAAVSNTLLWAGIVSWQPAFVACRTLVLEGGCGVQALCSFSSHPMVVDHVPNDEAVQLQALLRNVVDPQC